MRQVRVVPRSALRVDLPSVTQRTDHTCGPAALVAIARHAGLRTDEATLARRMRCGPEGSDPVQLRAVLTELGLPHREARGMRDRDLRQALRAGLAVVLAIQAHGEGHWVVAIGVDARGVYVEDPWLGAARGMLTWRELAACWHDVEGRPARPLVRYGLVVTPGSSARGCRAGSRASSRS